MYKQLTSFVVLFFLYFLGFAQDNINSENIPVKLEKAYYLNNDLEKELYKTIRYPVKAASNDINGEVVIEITITKEGFAKDIKLLKYDDKNLSAEAYRVVKKLDGRWSPTIKNGIPVDKTFLIVFQFIMADFNPIKNTITRTEKLIAKKKYDKALKVCNNSLKDWAYEPKLYKQRARIYSCLDDKEASAADQLYSMTIRYQMLTDIIFIKAHMKHTRTIIRSEVETVD